MPFDIKYDHPPCGYAKKSARIGDSVEIVDSQFVTSEDGMALVQLLEGVVSPILDMLPLASRVPRSQIEHLLMHVDRDGYAKVYVNELKQLGRIKPKGDFNKGDAVYDDDVVDLHELRFEGIELPQDHGVLVVLSHGWRKGLYFDFRPIGPAKELRQADLWKTLGRCLSYLWFQEVHSISPQVWAALFANKWFPFAALSTDTLRKMIVWAGDDLPVDELLPEIKREVVAKLPTFRRQWANQPLLTEHCKFLEAACECFANEAWIAANAILYPRIEGILRQIAGASNNLNQQVLSAAARNRAALHDYSRLLPNNFEAYLKSVYFASFDPAQEAQLSRNSVAHGVVPSSEMSEKAAVLAILIIQQILYHLPPAAR